MLINRSKPAPSTCNSTAVWTFITILALFHQFGASCKFPMEVADFVWNPDKVDGAGYYLPMAMTSTEQPPLPGAISSPTCTPRFSGSSTTPLTVYSVDCGNQLHVFRCAQIGSKGWVLDCKQDMSITTAPAPATATAAPSSPTASASISAPAPPAIPAPPEIPSPPPATGTGSITSPNFNSTVSSSSNSTPEAAVSASGSVPPQSRYPVWCFWCGRQDTPAPEQDFSHTVLVSLTDQKTYAFINRCCYKLGRGDWVVFSTLAELPQVTRIEIMAHAISLGY